MIALSASAISISTCRPAAQAQRYASNVSHSYSPVGPAVKLLLSHYQIDVNLLQASGPKKNILKSDVIKYINSENLSPLRREIQMTKIDFKQEVKATRQPPLPLRSGTTKPTSYVDIPLTSVRQIIAKRLSQSKSIIPHAYSAAVIPADKIEKLRKDFGRIGIKLSVNDFIIKACALALQSVPEVNVQWKGGDSLQRIHSIDISIAVATPTGLITPILFAADQLSVDDISQKLRGLADRAREGRLRPEEFQGGSFTISNLGMFGSVSNFTAIINPPQAAILAVGGIERHWNIDSGKTASEFGVTLCYDARAIEEAEAHRFLFHLRLALAQPETLLLGMKQFNGVDTFDVDEEDNFEPLMILSENDFKNDDLLAKILLQ